MYLCLWCESVSAFSLCVSVSLCVHAHRASPKGLKQWPRQDAVYFKSVWEGMLGQGVSEASVGAGGWVALNPANSGTGFTLWTT